MSETSLTPQARIKSLVETEGMKKRFTDVLGNRANAFLQSIVSAYTSNESLAKCDPMSVISSAMIAATLDLPINAALGMAHIVPYKGVGTFQMGWKGFVQLGLRSSQYKTMNATVIYEGQLVKNDQFTGEVEFKAEAASDKVVGYLFYFKLMNGFEKYTYWTKEQCEAHAKKYSASYQYKKGKWVDDFDSMALKTVVKMGLSKWGILSLELQKAIEVDESSDGVYPDAFIPEYKEENKEPGQPNRLKDIVNKKSSVETTAEPEIKWGEPAPKSEVPI